MTVKQLITKLMDYPMDADIHIKIEKNISNIPVTFDALYIKDIETININKNRKFVVISCR